MTDLRSPDVGHRCPPRRTATPLALCWLQAVRWDRFGESLVLPVSVASNTFPRPRPFEDFTDSATCPSCLTGNSSLCLAQILHAPVHLFISL